MSFENSPHRSGGQPAGAGAARIIQSTGRVPWVRLVRCLIVTLTMAGAASWMPVPTTAAETLNVEQQVAAFLTAGEFGAALNLAAQAANAAERATLIEQVANAQLQAGETGAVEASLRQLPAGPERDRLQQSARQQRSAGGGNLANPGPLMMMIQQ